jgi:hypothetical protein
MKSNVYDLATDEIKLRLANVNGLLHETFKGTNPYRKKPVSAKERYFEYANMPEEEKMFARQNFPNEMAIYEQEMQNLSKRYQNG